MTIVFYFIFYGIFVGIEPLKVGHDVTKLELTIPLVSFWCINIDLSILSMSHGT